MKQTQMYTAAWAALFVFYMTQAVILAQTETVPPNYCPNCWGTHGTWNIDNPWNREYCIK